MKIREFLKPSVRLAPLRDEEPDSTFLDFHERHGASLARVVARRKESDPNLIDLGLSAGLLPPLRAIVDEEIRHLCWLPYRKRDGTVGACVGVTNGWQGCPPRSTELPETLALLERAVAFLIVKLDGIRDHRNQKYVNRFARKVGRSLSAEGSDVLAVYGSGPCRRCKEGCDAHEECPQPAAREFALESCGFWVSHLCKEASRHPINGSGPAEIRWVTDWNLPTQDVTGFGSVVGVLLGERGGTKPID